MKVWFALLASIGLASLFLAFPEVSGTVESQPLEIIVEDVVIFGEDAFVIWSTSREAASVFSFGNQTVSFNNSMSFEILLQEFDRGVENFSIFACALDQCDEVQMPLQPYLRTRVDESSAHITGAVTGVAGVIGSHMAMGLFGLMVMALAGGIGYSRMRSVDPMNDLIRRAGEHVNAEEYDSARNLYVMAREAFQQLEHDKKVRNHPELLKLHNILKRYSVIKEAQTLTEKYEEGTITRQEMKRLNDMMFF